MIVLLRVPDVDDPDFVAEVSYAEGVLRLCGSADRSTATALANTLDTVHAELCRRGARAIVVDLISCDYMAAPCFRQLLAWIDKIQELDAGGRYRIRLRGNASLAWQKHGLAALACFDTALIVLEVT